MRGMVWLNVWARAVAWAEVSQEVATVLET